MPTTRATLRHEIDTQLATVIGKPSATRTATGGSTSTLVDTARSETDDYWNNSWLYIASTTDGAAPQGEESLVADFVAATDTLTVSPGFSAAVGVGDTYELRRYFSAAMIHSAINLAIQDAQYQLRVETEDETLVVVEDSLAYTLPADVEHVLRLDLLEHEVAYRGTATAGTASTLSDSSRSWGTDDLIGYEVAVYEGTGAGQYRTVESNTDTALTVSEDWTTNPDTTSKYVVKDVAELGYRHRIVHANIVGSSLFLRQHLPRGQRLIVTYVPVHTDLSTDASTTEVPKSYIVMRAVQHLMLMSPATLPETLQSQAHRMHDRLELQVQRYLQMNKRTEVAGTYWNRGGATKQHWYQGGGLSIGTKKEL